MHVGADDSIAYLPVGGCGLLLQVCIRVSGLCGSTMVGRDVSRISPQSNKHSSHLGFIGVGGEHSTYIIRFEALCSQQPFRVYWGGGGTFYLHHPL